MTTEPAGTNRPLTWTERWWLHSRCGRWLRRPLLCKISRHKWSADHWGFGGAVIDWFCARCEKQIGSTALDDASKEAVERIHAAKEILGFIGPIGPYEG